MVFSSKDLHIPPGERMQSSVSLVRWMHLFKLLQHLCSGMWNYSELPFSSGLPDVTFQLTLVVSELHRRSLLEVLGRSSSRITQQSVLRTGSQRRNVHSTWRLSDNVQSY